MSPRRVLHILPTAEPGGTAMVHVVTSLAKAVDPARYQIHAGFLRDGGWVEELHRDGIEATCVQWTGSARDLRGVTRYSALLRSSKWDLLHQHIGGRLLTRLGRSLTGAKNIIHLHGRASEKTGEIPTTTLLPRHDAVIAVCRMMAEFSGDSSAIVIYSGVDATRFATHPQPHANVVLGTACRIEAVKGLSCLLDALAILVAEFPNLRLEIAGEGSLRWRLEQQAQQLGLDNTVEFLGWRNDLPSVFPGWDIFVLPSLDEGFPITGLEAMAAGLPLVASAVGGVPELVKEGDTALLVRPAAPAELAAQLRQLILDPSRRMAMGAKGRQRAITNFPLSRMTDEITTLYDRLLGT